MKRCRHRSGQCYLPDKEFRYLRTVQCVSIDAEASLARSSSFGKISCISLCRSDCIIHDLTNFAVVAWRAVSEDSPGCNEPSMVRPSDREPFLLIVRTLRFVTAARATSIEGCSEFPANSQVYLRNYNSVQTLRCSLPIVTAAVYRGFDQELRLAADPIT